ncbi:hypothetical protein LCGC14_1127890 [marine sediment metagenome]|uniref:Uncharacterized protein n=1 Tax=marine sediment metagenome TaxID=412755 RepID=A0A0F9M235_9ZZZZ|nr:MAG: hypothetical protein Lokiarch_02660 [Candidatus Lokiarchaeum sp. GC14_75]HEA70975.1 hypothetical protein [archaeon]
MIGTEEAPLVNMICPYCKESFRKQVDYQKKTGLFTILIKNHPKSQDCAPFIAFIDNNGRHRGSQKIDDVEKETSLNGHYLDSARNSINEVEKTLRFYHLKVPRRQGRGFDHKVAGVKDRSFMSSKAYLRLLDFLSENDDENAFGVNVYDDDGSFEGGILVYGKYMGMIFTMFWRDQKDLQNKTLDEVKGYSNLTVEKLIGLYDLMDFFF